MKYLVLVNAKAGTVRDRGRAALKSELESVFKSHRGSGEVRMLHPRDLTGEIKKALRRKSPPTAIVVGGGDGSLSTAAGLLAGGKTALGVLPLGTMNLMARALGVPLDPAEAIAALIKSKPVRIDLLDINGRSVLMHASIGLQPKIIRVREALPYRTRFMRLTNGVIAWVRVVRSLQPIRISGKADGRRFERVTSAMLISNNVMPEGFGETPVSHDMTRGRIAVYITSTTNRRELVRLALATSLGAWRDSELVEEITTRHLVIDANKKSLLVSLDGEVARLDTPLDCAIRPKCLKIMVPPAGDAENLGARLRERVT